jgi:hypothetical protein
MEQLLPARERVRFRSPVQVVILQHIQELEGDRSETIPILEEHFEFCHAVPLGSSRKAPGV